VKVINDCQYSRLTAGRRLIMYKLNSKRVCGEDFKVEMAPRRISSIVAARDHALMMPGGRKARYDASLALAQIAKRHPRADRAPSGHRFGSATGSKAASEAKAAGNVVVLLSNQLLPR
jgi:hypothetical protein